MARIGSALAAGMVVIASVGVPAAAEEAAGDIVLERIWFRTERVPSIPKAFKGNGDLRIAGDGLHFLHKNKPWFLPWDRIRRISLGPMKGDLDTDWVVLAAPDSDLGPLIGLRDGKRMGYGVRTEPLFEQIKAAARAVRAAQFDVPDGFTTYEGLEHLLTLAVPSDWSLEHRSSVVQDGRVHEGVVVFHEPVGSASRGDALRGSIDSGELRAIRLERRKSSKGMKEDGFSEKAVLGLVQEMEQDRHQLAGLETETPLETAPFELDGRTGVRLSAVGTDSSGVAHHVDLVAVCEGRMLFLFRTRGPVDRRQEDAGLLETVAATVRFSTTR